MASVFLKDFAYFDGKALAQNVDILERMETLSASRCWNMLDSMIIQDMLEDAQAQEGLSELRARVKKIYAKIYEDSDSANDNSASEYDYSQDPDYEGIYIPGNYSDPADASFSR